MARFGHFPANRRGRDIAVGDIHGHFTRLRGVLGVAGFDPAVDRLFSVGDLVDRGPESGEALDWLDRPWFFPVQGNHEDFAIRYALEGRADAATYAANGGQWFIDLPEREQRRIALRLAELPLALEVETPDGLVGLVHADCPLRSWDDLRLALTSPDMPRRLFEQVKMICQWSRERIYTADERVVAGVRAVVVGHTPIQAPVVLGNVHHIDTGGWLDDRRGHFTLIDLRTLQILPTTTETAHGRAA